MKKNILPIALALLCVLLAGCGKKAASEGEPYRGIAPDTDDLSAITERTEYYDITVQSEHLFDFRLTKQNPQSQEQAIAAAMSGRNHVLVGTQFFQGEPIQLWAEHTPNGSSIHLYKKDGTSELVLQGVPSSYTAASLNAYQWYIGQDRSLYCYRSLTRFLSNGTEITENTLIRFLPDGQILYNNALDESVKIRELRQMGDGKIYILFRDSPADSYILAELDPAAGDIIPDSQIEIPYHNQVHLGAAGESPVVTGHTPDYPVQKIMEVNAADGSLSPVIYFTGVSYGWHNAKLCGLQVLDDGQIELLWTDDYGQNCLWESLRMEKVKKIPIVVRGIDTDSWLEDKIAQFNTENSACHVVLETCGKNNDSADFSRLTSVQIGSGKGPDILLTDLDLDFAGMLEKGALEDLTPYMKASGIREEDYFPFVFASWRQGEHIYSISYCMDVWGEQISEDVLGSREVPDIETLADALLAREGNCLYRSGYDSAAVLKTFLQGTDSLWGMVDWEHGSCDFNTPLFGKLLEAARRYGDDGRKTPDSGVAEELEFDSFFWYNGQADQAAAKNVTCGVLFDDGCHPACFSRLNLVLNTHSPNKEAAWEFISYLIGAECLGRDFLFYIPPIHRETFKEWLPAMIARWGIRHYENGLPAISAYFGSDISEQKQAEYINAIEDARPLPTRTAPILTVILEEAQDYFNGSKSAEEVSQVINNRVQLFLDERKQTR